MTIEEIILFFKSMPELVSFLGALLGGEETILVVSFFAGQGIFSVKTVLIFSYIGTMVSDWIWFYIGYKGFGKKMESRSGFQKNLRRVERVIEKITKDNHFMTLLLTKFLYGTRIITIIYLSREKLKFWEYTKLNSIVSLFWLVIIVPMGALAGRGSYNFINIFKDTQKTLLLILIAVIILYIIRLLINKLILKKIS